MSWFRKYTKTHFMKRKILLIISIGLILLSACSKEREQTVGEENSSLEDEKTENAFYQMFYGEWEITECVYLDKIPVSGVEYTEEEMLEASQEVLAGAWKKIQFTRERIVIDDNQTWETVRYNISGRRRLYAPFYHAIAGYWNYGRSWKILCAC